MSYRAKPEIENRSKNHKSLRQTRGETNNTIPESHKVLFEKPILASLATILPDGHPQVNPVRCDFDGTYVRVNTVQGGQKGKNLQECQFAKILLVDPEDTWFWIEVRGRVEESTTEGADEHIDQLAKKYLGIAKYIPGNQKTRVMQKIKIERIVKRPPPIRHTNMQGMRKIRGERVEKGFGAKSQRF